MVNALVVRKGTNLAKRTRALRAAQYVRMSREFQRYSIKNQLAAIAAYAQANNLTIVRTYADEGRSGLRIKNRPGLIELIEDVQSGQADFDHILVYDVSRWGRFQDVDESAHYEFLCKRSGVHVEYCAEEFKNDGTFMSGLAKNMKRGMAAEWSRDLSVKVHAGLCRIASLGYRAGGPIGFGLRRELIGEDHRSKGYLKRGQQKNLKTDRVVLRLGKRNEIKVIQRIFLDYVRARRSEEEIVRRLNRDGVRNHHGRPWTRRMIDGILRNENFIGNTVYNRESRPLRGSKVKNSPDLWVRTKGSIPPVIEPGVFLRAQRRLRLRWLHLTDDELLLRLKLLLKKEGRLSERIINGTLGIPSIDVFAERFGSLRSAYRRIGYEPKWNFDWIDRKHIFKELVRAIANKVIEQLETYGRAAHFESGADVLTIEGRIAVSLRLARSWRDSRRPAIWTINRRIGMPKGYILAIRLDEQNNHILDYILLPTEEMIGSKIRFTEAGLHRFEGRRFNSIARLTRPLVELLQANVGQQVSPPGATQDRASTTRRGPSKRPPTPAKSRRRNAHARH